jgi:mannose-6-phosphate isomerase-like protein (cupin superfamily)
MQEIKIVDLRPGLIKGVSVELPDTRSIYRETYFEWEASNNIAEYAENAISGGVLRAWKHTPNFEVVETHKDKETFYFIKGTAIMLFVDVVNGKPDMKTVQVVRIQKGAVITIEAGKGHFVAVAEDDNSFEAIVISPKMDAPRCNLAEPVMGI